MHTRLLLSATLCVGALAVTPGAAAAQRAADAMSGIARTREVGIAGVAGFAPVVGSHSGNALPTVRGISPAARARGGEDERARVRGTWWTPLASAVIPGIGQLGLRQERALPYIAAEAFGWLRYATDQREAKRQRREYRALARDVARRGTFGRRPDGNWEYYERMEHFASSGAFDVTVGGALDPETDTTTFNGAVWQLARQTYWESPDREPETGSPAFFAAQTFYQERAIGEAFRWSWAGAELERDVFRQTIARSNDAYRRAAVDLAAIIANHALSSVDAYVTVRLRRRRAITVNAPDGVDASVSIPFGAPPKP